jgi:methyl-accepting chemotaxis protein
MKLHTKLILSLLAGLIIVISAAQIYQFFNIKKVITGFAQANLEIIQQREEKAANNIYKSVEYAIAGSLERGEMEKFNHLLNQQKEVEGLLEFSLHDRKGVVTHSTGKKFLKTTLPADVKVRLLSSPDKIVRRTTDSIEIFQPQVIYADCVRCHTSWPEGKIGGVTHFRFSTVSVKKASQQVQAATAKMEKAFLNNSAIILVAVITVMVVMMIFLMKRLIAAPLKDFVNLLRLFDEDEGDLTRRIQIKTQDEIGILGGLFNSFIRKLNDIISGVQRVAIDVGEGANRQASTVEETSAAMEQISAQTSLNAEHSQSTNSLMKEASQIVDGAHDSMTRLATCLEEISTTSKDTSKVVKSIDEIAFQTNLLALNAAVEAARAGEAGAGFAVVADEVRNLALRAATSAKETEEMIQNTLKKIDDGVALGQETQEAFAEVAQRSRKAAELVGEIDASSHEQAQGIEQIKRALEEMDTVTQHNAQESEKLTSTMSIFKTDDAQKRPSPEQLLLSGNIPD